MESTNKNEKESQQAKALKTEKIYKRDYSHYTQDYEEEFLYSVTDFTPEGHVAQTKIFSSDNQLVNHHIQKYSEEADLIEDLMIDVPNELRERVTYEYDKKNNLTYATQHFQDDSTHKSMTRHTFEPDSTTIEHLDDEKQLLQTEHFKFKDKEKELVEYSKITDADQNIIQEGKHEYDKDNNKVSDIAYEYGEFTIIKKTCYKDDLLRNEEEYHGDVLVNSTEYEYENKNTSQKRTTVDYQQKWNEIVDSEFTEDGRLSKVTMMHSAIADSCHSLRYEYEFY